MVLVVRRREGGAAAAAARLVKKSVGLVPMPPVEAPHALHGRASNGRRVVGDVRKRQDAGERVQHAARAQLVVPVAVQRARWIQNARAQVTWLAFGPKSHYEAKIYATQLIRNILGLGGSRFQSTDSKAPRSPRIRNILGLGTTTAEMFVLSFL